MKKNKQKEIVRLNKARKRFRSDLRRSKIKQKKRRQFQNLIKQVSETYEEGFTIDEVVNSFLPSNLKYLISHPKTDFDIKSKKGLTSIGVFPVPKHFSIVSKPKESYSFIRDLVKGLLSQTYDKVFIDYGGCEKVDLGAQVFLDIILKDIIAFYKKCDKYKRFKPRTREIRGRNILNPDVQKLLHSVGTYAILRNRSVKFDDIEPYPLCVHNREDDSDYIETTARKEIDTTNLADYVINSLGRMGKTLTEDKLEDLCNVIGEILINAEEHSSTKYRYSIGYFHDFNERDMHHGIFNLVIFNFGKTIYEKFKDPDCPNKAIVSKMNNLSQNYTAKKLFAPKKFEEETLWTLYALQDGVTSTSPIEYRKRGNGSIQFIESFFNIKGPKKQFDDISRMSILSGNTNITFDGTYNIMEKKKNGDNFKVMTFNKTGNIEDKPDRKFVKFVEDYFPGTMISAKILFNEDDLKNENT